MNSLHQQYLKAMDITVWQPKDAVSDDIECNLPEGSTDSWHELFQCVRNCTQCGLDRTRKNTVFGSGSNQADLLIVGEAPGANEDKQGAPFVGRGGMDVGSQLRPYEVLPHPAGQHGPIARAQSAAPEALWQLRGGGREQSHVTLGDSEQQVRRTTAKPLLDPGAARWLRGPVVAPPVQPRRLLRARYPER